MKEDKLLACVCVCVCLLCSFVNKAGRYATRLSETEKQKGNKRWKSEKQKEHIFFFSFSFFWFSQKEEISCAIRSHVDVVEPLRFVGSNDVNFGTSETKNKSKRKRNNPKTFQEISIVERISLSFSSAFLNMFGRRVFWPFETLDRPN